MKLLRLLLPIFLFPCCQAQKLEKIKRHNNDNSLLWEISGPQLSNQSYLFGTFHLMCKEDIHFSPSLLMAVDLADEVYFEMELDDPSNTLGALFFVNMKEGKTLKDLYTETEYQRLNRFIIDSLGMPISMIERMKPSFLEALFYPIMMPCKHLSGVEEELMKIAKKGKKEIRGFETIAMQAAVFDSIPYVDQAKDLLKTIDSMEMYKKHFSRMLEVYKKQELKSIEDLFTQEEFGIGENRDILLDRRNINWVNQLTSILPKTKIFIAVGAGHLVGENGLISLLRKAGYTLRPLENRQDQ